MLESLGTSRIVSVLEGLAPDRPLNAQLRQIVEQVTGKSFKQDDNADWTRITRPILEAFFHARFFLEMAVRYAKLCDLHCRCRAGTPRFFTCMACAESNENWIFLKPLPTGADDEEEKPAFDFDGRSRRPPRDPVDVRLSPGCSLLARAISQ